MESERSIPLTTLSSNGARVSQWRLKLLVFVAGAVLMALEMAGSRILAAHFGSSIYVWGSIIGIFLTALSLGYFVGGLLADWRPSPFFLSVLVLLAGCWLLLLPIYANWICRGIRGANLGARLEPLLATLLLFGGPSVLIGMVSPFAVRLAASAIDRLGNTAGRLYALSTVGSIAGTLVTAFWLIPLIGVHTIFRFLGFTLIAVAILGLRWDRKTIAVVGLILLIFLPTLWLKPASFISLRSDQHVRFEGDSAYHHVLVVDDDHTNWRLLRFNNYVQSVIDQRLPYDSDTYVNSFELARIFKPNLKRVLFIGGGGAIGPRKLIANDPNVIVDLVEIDPVVVDISHKFFYLAENARLRIHVEDGRRFVRQTRDKYDLVVLDAFTIGGQIPFHLTTTEFMSEVKNVLAPDGVFLANITSAVDGPGSKIFRSVYKTVGNVFPEICLFPRPYPQERGQPGIARSKARNIILVGLLEVQNCSANMVSSRVASLLTTTLISSPTFLDDALHLYKDRIPTDDVPLLTDDYAPVDTMVF